MTEVGCILECAGHANGKDAQRFQDAVLHLNRARLFDQPVAKVIAKYEEPTPVCSFGCDYLCQHDNPLPWGVKRYFGVTLFFNADLDWREVLGGSAYWLLGEKAQIVICSCCILPQEWAGPRVDLVAAGDRSHLPIPA